MQFQIYQKHYGEVKKKPINLIESINSIDIFMSLHSVSLTHKRFFS